jgi:hypothetical protein
MRSANTTGIERDLSESLMLLGTDPESSDGTFRIV